MKMKRAAAALILLTVIACGKRDDPHPPVPIIPQATSDLLVTQRGNDVILSWSYPSLTASGQKLSHFDRILVYRYVETLPATAAPTAAPAAEAATTDPTKPTEVVQFATVPAITPEQFRKLRERVAMLPSEHVPEYVAGARIVYNDTPDLTTPDARPVRINYAVVTESGGAESPLSNIVSIVPLDVPSAVQNLRAAADATGVRLTWTAPQHSVAASAGYNIYRFPPTGEIVELGSPINKAPVTETTYVDLPSFGAYRYVVTAVRTAGPPVAESEPTQTVYVEYKDLAPPPAPTGVAALSEESAVRLVWDAVDAPDLAGYKVYRSAGAAKKLMTATAITETTFRDATPERGVTYVYSVTSVDKLGNESAATSATPVMIPR